MLHVPLPGGARMPALGLGTYRLRGRDAYDAVAHALALGYRHLDTAWIYDNEEAVGAALRASGVPRGDVWITTKVWPTHLRAEALQGAVQESLQRLGTDYVDLLLVHWPNPDVPLAETLGALADARAAGQARHLGVSNFPPGLLAEALRLEPGLVTNQVEYHPYLGQARLRALLRAHGLVLTAYSPLGRGRPLADPVVRAIAAAHGRTPAQVVLRWHLQQDRVVAIPKAATAAHRAANLAVFDFALSDDEMARLHALDRGERLVHPAWAPDWDA